MSESDSLEVLTLIVVESPSSEQAPQFHDPQQISTCRGRSIFTL